MEVKNDAREGRIWKDWINTLERSTEKKENEERNRNSIFKGLKVEKKTNEGRKEGVERLLNEIGVVGKVEEVRGFGGKNRKGREVI